MSHKGGLLLRLVSQIDGPGLRAVSYVLGLKKVSYEGSRAFNDGVIWG